MVFYVNMDRKFGRRRRAREKVYAGYEANDKIADMGMFENLK